MALQLLAAMVVRVLLHLSQALLQHILVVVVVVFMVLMLAVQAV
jgi:hypothetical protein